MRYYEAWAKQLPETQELSVNSYISAKMLDRLNLTLLEQVDRQTAKMFVRAIRRNGQEPVKATVKPTGTQQAEVVFWTVDTKKKAALEDYTLALEDAARCAYFDLEMPWWKLAWRRIQGRLVRRPVFLGEPHTWLEV